MIKREEQGSTFFNEGLAFPHVRVTNLTVPFIALGLTKQGVSDVDTENPVELVFLILTPAETPDVQIQVLGLSSRAVQNRHFLQSLRSARTPEEVFGMIRNLEIPD